MSEQNEAIVRRAIQQVWMEGHLFDAEEFFANQYTHHDQATPDFGGGPIGEKKRVAFYRDAFPDLTIHIEELASEGNTVTCRWSATGTHKGPLGGIEPTGRQIDVVGIAFYRIVDRRIVDAWVNWDALGLLQQLGVVPIVLRKRDPSDPRTQGQWKTTAG
jgi:predicted ester cyclase